jgi:hypothetical protein
VMRLLRQWAMTNERHQQLQTLTKMWHNPLVKIYAVYRIYLTILQQRTWIEFIKEEFIFWTLINESMLCCLVQTWNYTLSWMKDLRVFLIRIQFIILFMIRMKRFLHIFSLFSFSGIYFFLYSHI